MNQKEIKKVKLQIIEELNQIVEELTIPGEIDYVELPNRITIESTIGEELDDSIFGIRKDEAIINSMFNKSTPKLTSFSLEFLLKILEQARKYKIENY